MKKANPVMHICIFNCTAPARAGNDGSCSVKVWRKCAFAEPGSYPG